MKSKPTLRRSLGGLLLALPGTMLMRTGLAGFLVALPVALSAARVTPDVPPAQKRQATVANGERLAQRKTLPPLPADLPSPFNPPENEKTEGQSASGPRPGQPATPVAPVKPVAPPGDRETLESLAAQISSTGVIQMPDRSWRLTIGRKLFEVGTRFTVTFNNQDYELELVSIDRTTFTLRYRGEEMTRPIKLTR